MFRFVTLSTSPSAPQFRTKSARSDMKTNAKQNMRWIQNDSILRSMGNWALNYRLIFFQNKCETKYDSVCRDVQVFCQNFLQIEADCFRLQDTQCQTFEETKCDKELTVEYYLYFTFFSLQLFSVIRCTRTSAPWPTKRNTRRSAPPSRSRSVRHGPLGNWNKPVMTLTLHFKMILLFQFLIRDRRPNTTPWQRLSARLNMRRCMMNNALQVLFSHQRLVPHDIDISVVETVYDNKCEKVYETVYEV